ncbi:MAG: hypothetical protein ACRD3M_01110, partial [Thermoanaerobaculia bacterium]
MERLVIVWWILLALLGPGDSSRQDLFQVSFLSGGTILAQEAPVERQGRLVFRRHPDGVLLSVRKSEVAGIAAVSVERPTIVRPGEQLDVGFTGEGAPRPEEKGGPPQPGLRRGQGQGGSFPVRPNWQYRSVFGTRLIVGYN